MVPIAALIFLAGCDRTPRMERTNAATQTQLNAIAERTDEHDGQVVRSPPLTSDDVGKNMRVGATKAPQPH